MKFKLRLPDFNKIRQRILQHRVVRRISVWSKKRSLPGFFKIPIYDVVIFLYNELKRYDLITRANSAAFSFFLSLFPSLMVLFTLIPYLKDYFLIYLPGGEQFDGIVQTEIKRILPGVAGDRLSSFIDDITNNPRVGLLSFGFVMAIIFASNGMLALMRGFDKSYHDATFKNRTAWQSRIIAIGLTFWIGLMLIGSSILIILGNSIVKWMSAIELIDRFSASLILILRYVATIVLFYTSVSFIYRFGAAARKKFSIFSAGTTLATVLCILSSTIFSAYVNNFNTYNELYGSIGTIIVLMLWIQINVLFLFFGFELNASIAVNRDLKQVQKEKAI